MNRRLSRRDALLAMAAALSVAEDGTALPEPLAKPPVLVFLFLRGAMDGLSALVPYTDAAYYHHRDRIAIPRPGQGAGAAVDLDGQFALHPALGPLLPGFRRGELAFVHAVGSQHETRSHFDAQDFMELGTPGRKRNEGWLTRAVRGFDANAGPRAVALEEPLPRSLEGEPSALAIAGIDRVRARRQGPLAAAVQSGFARMYQDDPASDGAPQAVATTVKRRGAAGFALFERLDPLIDVPPRALYPDKNKLGQSLADVARLVRAGLGRVFTLSSGGWDTHRAQGASEGHLATAFHGLATALAAFREDLGDDFERVLVLGVTEFGRTVRQNGTGGTDHGHGSVMLAWGGNVRGGKVYGTWPGLGEAQLYEGRDLQVTTDFRDVFAEVARRHLGVRDASPLFPGYTLVPARSLGLLG
jgi:uncharacterized protein (DUF1501 family)